MNNLTSLKKVRTNLQAERRGKVKVILNLSRPLTNADFSVSPKRAAIISKKVENKWSVPDVGVVNFTVLEPWDNKHKAHGSLKVWNFIDSSDDTEAKLEAARRSFGLKYGKLS